MDKYAMMEFGKKLRLSAVQQKKYKATSRLVMETASSRVIYYPFLR